MKLNPFRLFLCAIIVLFPVVLWNVILLDYINTSGKAVAWLLTPVFAFAGTVAFLGTSHIKKPVYKRGEINPFYGWLLGCLVISIMITLLSNG
jgi:hypothetical protein